MKSTLRVFAFLSLACLFSLNESVQAAENADYGMPAGSLVVPDGLSAAEVQKCIAEAAVSRGWNVVSRDQEKVVVALEQGKWSARITLAYTAKAVEFFSKSTRSGKPKLPENWLSFLKQDVTIKINSLAISKT